MIRTGPEKIPKPRFSIRTAEIDRSDRLPFAVAQHRVGDFLLGRQTRLDLKGLVG